MRESHFLMKEVSVLIEGEWEDNTYSCHGVEVQAYAMNTCCSLRVDNKNILYERKIVCTCVIVAMDDEMPGYHRHLARCPDSIERRPLGSVIFRSQDFVDLRTIAALGILAGGPAMESLLTPTSSNLAIFLGNPVSVDSELSPRVLLAGACMIKSISVASG